MFICLYIYVYIQILLLLLSIALHSQVSGLLSPEKMSTLPPDRDASDGAPNSKRVGEKSRTIGKLVSPPLIEIGGIVSP